MPATVIFDMDGTLIDTEKYFRTAWPEAVRRFGYTMTDEQSLELRSLGRPFAVDHFRKLYGEEFDYDKVRSYRKQIMEEILEKNGIELKPGAKELLSYLKEHGYRTAVATASDLERTKRYLDKVGITTYFNELISAVMVKEGKPSPDVYLYACKQLGEDPGDCFAVEDSPNGVISAYRAGCKVIMIPDQTAPEERLKGMLYACLDSLNDMIGFLEKNS